MQLIITEKPTSAKKVANALNIYAFEKYKSITYFQSQEYIIFGIKGHIFQRNYAQQYFKWASIPPAELLNKQVLKELKDKTLKDFIKYIHKLHNITTLGLFTDFDSEGELIAKDVRELVLENSKTITKTIRYTVSSLVQSEIISAIKNPTELNLGLAVSSETRHILDLQFGIILTRSLSLSYMKAKNLRFIKVPLSIGRVQTPLLKIIGDRHTEIKNFVPIPFFEYVLCTAEKLIFKGKSDVLLNVSLNSGDILDVGINVSEKTIKTPRPMNSADLIKIGNSLAYNSKQTMQIAEKLYLQGLITYPRTDSRFITVESAKSIFDILYDNKLLSEFILFKPRSEYIFKINQGKEDKAHPSILPTSDIKIPTDEKERNLYFAIIKHFLNIISMPTQYYLEKGHINICNVDFEIKTHKLIESGFMNYTPEYTPLPSKVKYKSLSYTQKHTLPPSHYTNTEIIMLMEKNKLGTKSTRHVFLPLLKERFYVNAYNDLTKHGELVYSIIKHSEISSLDFNKLISSDLKEIEIDATLSEKVIEKYNPKILQMISELSCNVK